MRASTWIAVLIWLLSLVAALLGKRDLFYNTFYLVTLVLLGSWLWTRLNLRNLEILRRVRTPRSQVGRFVEETLTVSNKSKLPKLWVEVYDESDLPGHRASRVLVALKGKESRDWVVRTPSLRRGEYHLGPIELRSSDPLGIFELRRKIPGSSRVIIYPPAFDIPGFRLPPGRLPGGKIARHRTHYLTANVATVRDYAPGDSFNRIHWPSTARTGRLIVKEFELDPTSDVWIMLDLDATWHTGHTWQPVPAQTPVRPSSPYHSYEPALAPATIEYATAAAASIAQRYLSERRAVGLLAYAPGRQIIQLERGHRQFTKILETLAVVDPVDSISFQRVLAAEKHFLDRNVTVVAITPAADSAWVAALREYQRAGISVTAVLIAASTFGTMPSYRPILAELWASQIPVYVLRRGESLTSALSQIAPPE